MRKSLIVMVVLCGAASARAGLIIPQGIEEQVGVPSIYSPTDGATIGAAAFPIAQRYFDAFLPLGPVGAGSFVVSGTLSHFRPNRPSQIDYAAGGAYAYLDVTVDVFAASSDDLGYLFNARALASATARVDDGLPADFGPTFGGDFSVTLDGSAAALALQAGGDLVLRISARGAAVPFGGGQVVADLAYSVAFVSVPEPSSLALCGLGAVGLVGYARKRRAARG